MNTLKTIQTLARIGRVASRIIFICCIVGACVCVVGLSGSAILGENGFVLGGVSIQSGIVRDANESLPEMYAKLAQGILYCVGEAILCKIAEKYFRNELEAGTPFTLEGANELKKLGIYAIIIPMVMNIICAAGIAVAVRYFPEIKPFEADPLVSAGIGVMMIVMSFLCKHAAEIHGESVPVETGEEKIGDE